MIFYAQNHMTRPVRLSEATRQFAWDSLHGRYGRDAQNTDSVFLDGVGNFASLSALERYDLAIRAIAEQAPLRLCEGERISGAATLGRGICHEVPACFGGKAVFPSVSHLTVDFETVLRRGVSWLKEEAEASLVRYKGTEKEPFLRSCLSCLDSFALWHGRYLEALKGQPAYKDNYNNLLRVPFAPARTFYEAVQSLWFTFAFLRLCGNWPGIGRIDVLLGDYLKRDLASSAVTLDGAREILSHFFIKGCEWITGQVVGSGDAQHYQNILIGGIGADGKEVTNEVTYLVLDILEELGISDFPTSVRVNRQTDGRLLRRVAEVMRYGGGILAVYNEDLVISALLREGYAETEARQFANDGCWEVQIPGKTFFNYHPFDALQVLQKKTLKSYGELVDFPSFEVLYQSYIHDLSAHLEELFCRRTRGFSMDCSGEWVWPERNPCTVVSLFEEGCIASGRSYLEGGPVYNVLSPHIGGFADTVNALFALKRLVYEEKRLSLEAFSEILRKNWEGEEPLRQYVLNRYSYYGNDEDSVDSLASRLLSDFACICRGLNGRSGYRFPAGVSTFGRQLEWSSHRLASPHGRRSGDVLAANASPTPGTDRAGATAVIRSYCKADLAGLASGAALDLRLLPSNVEGEDGLQALIALMRGFVALGGFFMQPDVADAAVLRRAQEHPEEYKTLSVRVSGWNARFVTLNREWQNMVIEQNEH